MLKYPVSKKAVMKKHIIVSAFTIGVISLLILSGPATAVEINLKSLEGAHRQGKEIDFKVDVVMNRGRVNGELLPVQYTNITFTMPDGSEKTCKINNDDSVEGCDFLSVDEVKVTGNDDYGYGYGYGYDNGTKYGLGYGYGYGNGKSTTHVKYNLVIDSTNMPVGKYSAVANVFAGTTSPRIFSSEETEFRIFKAPTAKEIREIIKEWIKRHRRDGTTLNATEIAEEVQKSIPDAEELEGQIRNHIPDADDIMDDIPSAEEIIKEVNEQIREQMDIPDADEITKNVNRQIRESMR